jgi:hypothetical protein
MDGHGNSHTEMSIASTGQNTSPDNMKLVPAQFGATPFALAASQKEATTINMVTKCFHID